MQWLCSCGKEATTVEVQWVWREAAAIGQRHGRYVSYRCRIGCGECVKGQADCQYFQVRLTASTKQNLAGQILAEVMNAPARPMGYLPRTDLQRALRSIEKHT